MSPKIRDPAILVPSTGTAENITEARRQKALLKTGALQDAIFNSANFSSIATDARGVIQIFNVGAERMLGYAAADVVNMITPADISDPQELIARALALSLELGTQILPGFDALVFKASRGMEDIYELTYIRKDGSRFPAMVSVTALRDTGGEIIGYLLIGTDNSARKRAEAARLKSEEWANFALQMTHTGAWDLDLADYTIQRTLEHDRIFGYDSLLPEWTYEKFSQHVLPEDRAGVDLKFREAAAAQTEWNFQCRIRRLDGEVRWIWAVGQYQCDKTGQKRRFAGIVQDITELKQTERAHFKANALQSAIFSSANFSSIATDDMGVIQIFNIGAERMLGYTAAEVVNKITPANISDPQEMVARAQALSLELGTPISPGFDALVFKASRGIEDIYELTYIRKDGSRFPAIVSVTALRDARGGIIGYLLIGTDNSARKRAEAALLKAGALQNAIFNSANFSSIATDAKGVIQIFNVGAERMLGYSAADVVNKITPADISDPQEIIARAKALSMELGTAISPGFDTLVFRASRGIEDIYALTYIRKDGSRFPAIVSVTALRDAQGVIIGYLLIGTDNSARKQIEEQLRWTEESFRLMVESVTDYAIVMLDPDGHIVSWNSGAQRIMGYSAEEIVAQHFSQFYLREDIEAGKPKRDLTAAADQGRLEDEGWRVRKDGSTFWANEVYTAIRDQDGLLRGYAKLTRDLTGPREVEAELTGAKCLAEKANLAKSDFLSSMSHELRSPLNAILGFAQLMESDSQPPAPAQKESIAQILRAGWHLLKLIDEILDLAKVESGKVPISEEPVSLAEVMLECQGMIEPQALQRGIRMAYPQFDKPCFVRADRTRLKQVLINLLSNSIKYNIQRGMVEVTCAESAPDRIRVSIRDTGAGLYPAQLDQLFQAFNRLGQEAGGEEGTGIGLVVAKQLVELMGGEIGVESTVGLGSVFWFELTSVADPRLSAKESGAATSPQLALPHGALLRTLLYVEDNPANLTLVEQIIARHPHIRLLTAVNGMGGIELARLSQPDVILMDINLPGMNGFEALAFLRADPATAHIPVVALSANAKPSDIKKGLEAGFFRYMTKPIKVAEFMDTLNVALDYAGRGAAVSE